MPAESKVALVTGGARGIGHGIALELAGAGFTVAICGRRSPEQAQPALDALRGRGGESIYIQADVASGPDRANLLRTIEEQWGRIDVLVNNAGIAPRERADILEASEESFDELITTNLKGPYFLTQSAAAWMIRQRASEVQAGRAATHRAIIHISSISATVASVNRGDYCISKAGVAMATRLWAARLAAYGVSVYEVRPGIIESDMTAGVRAKYDALIEGGLLLEKRWGTPQDVGRAVRVLATGELPYATGAVLVVDGGLTLERL
ncbi:MAG TPA: 3-ketoacyl-ACP reductase [Terracidiphilus sp.]|jgi:NAD(P)-dependent dehydrogenase (short-subunit alcohol dehydrogenase family)